MPRRFRLIAAVSVLLIAAGSAAVASATSDSPEQLCARYQNIPIKGGRYTVMNNVWGATTGQCIEVTDDGAFRVAGTEHRNVDAAAAYPSIYAGCHWGACTRASNMPVRVNEIKSARSNWRIYTDAPGIWTATYDIWFHTSDQVNRSPDGAELMIWLDHTGGANPSGKIVDRNVRLAGTLWDVWYAPTTWNYVAYVRTKQTSAVRNLDIKAFTEDAVRRGYVKPSWFLTGIEAGFEIWRDGTGLASRDFSVTVAQGPPAPSAAGANPTPSAADATPSASARPPRPADPSGSTVRTDCAVHWEATKWDTGMVSNVTLTNDGAPLGPWWVEWSFEGDEQVENDWGVEITQTGQRVVARNAPYNAVLDTGESTTFGFQARHTGTSKRPSAVRLNGSSCALR